MVTKEEKAKVILNAIDELAPTTINWNLEKQWINAIVAGLKQIEE